ncbi:MAG: hypothetical protein ACR2RF_30585 [Geminicoccaceae bacterium]
MNPTTSAEVAASPSDLLSDHVTPDQKLVCLGSWLDRTTLKEGQAAQACSLLPASTLTIGTTFAGALVSVDQRWFAFCIFLIFVFGALMLFLYHHHRWTIWRAVAVQLQTEQKFLISAKRSEALNKAGRHPPERLAHWFDKREPLRPFAGPAIALYLATVILGVLLMGFAAAMDYHWLGPKPAAAAESPPASDATLGYDNGRRAIF